MLYTVICAILGREKAFSVKIDSDKQVSELKNQIKGQESQTLDPFAASALELYKVDIPVSDYSSLMESVSQNAVEYKEDQRLRNHFSKLSTVFGATGPLVGETKILHILVERPGSESFTSS